MNNAKITEMDELHRLVHKWGHADNWIKTPEQYDTLTPREKGFVLWWQNLNPLCGTNPFEKGTADWAEFDYGYRLAKSTYDDEDSL